MVNPRADTHKQLIRADLLAHCAVCGGGVGGRGPRGCIAIVYEVGEGCNPICR